MKTIKTIFVIIICIWNISCFAYELPDLGDYSTTVFTSKEEQKIGKEFMREVQNNMSLCSDPLISDYIQTLGGKLLKQTSAKKQHYHFFVVNDSNINAFSGPAGYIGVNTGTIVATRSESELAAVLAHEIAHSTQHHIERMIQQQKGMLIPETVVMAAAILAGVTAGGGAANAVSGAATAMAAGSAQHSINYTREMEAEADSIGIKILYKAGFDPNAMSGFFSRMQHLNYDYDDDAPAFLIDHPLTNKRIADSTGRAVNFPKTSVITNPDYYFIRARTQCLAAKNDSSTINFFKTERNNGQHTNAVQYGYAMALLQAHKYQTAEDVINKLTSLSPNLVLPSMLAAEIQLANKKTNAAITSLQNLLAKYPYFYPLVLQYAQTLIKAGRWQLATEFLRNKSIHYLDDAEIYRLLADAEAKSGHKADAYMAQAKFYAIAGYNRQAIILLQQALRLSNLSFNNKTIIEARINNLKQIELASRSGA